jgi:hypothetical protein
MFDRFGIRVSRFTYRQCVDNPDAVVREFMSLFKDYVPRRNDDTSVEVLDVDFKRLGARRHKLRIFKQFE